MISHFDSSGSKGKLPASIYARVDSVEEDGENNIIVSLDAVSIDSADALMSKYSVDEWPEKWRQCWDSRDDAMSLFELFENLDLINVLVTIKKKRHLYLDFIARENIWLEMTINKSPHGIQASAYTALFSESQSINLTLGRELSQSASKMLNAVFSMESWPQTPPENIDCVFKEVEAEYWLAFDVGQGSANGFSCGGPITFFHDLGCGAYANSKTAPLNAIICHSRPAPIILSHWDTDHWAGSYRFAPKNSPDIFLDRYWIAPYDRTIGPRHVAFALSILASGGKIYILPEGSWDHHIKIRHGKSLRLIKGSGLDRNSSGIAIELRNENNLRWLVAGDLDYKYMMNLSDNYVAISVPHHGAKPSINSMPPAPTATYSRLIYSFGPNNTYKHPSVDCINKHHSKGWNHYSWHGKTIPQTAASSNIRATGCNNAVTTHLGGIIVGWNTPASPNLNSACGGVRCSANTKQT